MNVKVCEKSWKIYQEKEMKATSTSEMSMTSTQLEKKLTELDDAV